MDEDVLELTQMVEEEPLPPPDLDDDPWDVTPVKIEDLLQAEDDEEEEPPPPPPKPKPRRMVVEDDDGALVSSDPAAKATAAFSNLAHRLGHERVPGVFGPMPIHDGGRTLEDVIKDLLRPLLREWLDDNLPLIVERLVKAEIEKMVRRARDY